MSKSASKCSKLEPGHEKSDRISSLPDHLLHHILSFLPIKQAVATSLILSKRWRPLGLSMPSLYFDDSKFRCLNSIIEFVDAVLFLSDSKPINMFRLWCKRFRVPPIRINLWINAVMNRKVEYLELYFADLHPHVDLHTRIFHNSIIKVLKLTRVMLNARSPVNLPSLKVMHLVEVKFSKPESAANIFSGCSSLEELVLKSKYVSGGAFNMPLKIGRFEHLVSAEVQPFQILALTVLSNVKFLRFVEHWLLPSIEAIPTFYNLTDLELSSVGTYDANSFVECLQRFPKLEILTIHKVEPVFGSRARLMDAMLVVPQFVALNLKKFCLGGYRGLEVQFQLAKFIMENASDLKTISICCPSEERADSKLQMLRRLSSCPRGSVNCKLLFN